MPSRYDTDVRRDAPNNAHAFMLSLVGTNQRVLELGAASGHVTRELLASGCDVTAVEIEEECAEALRGLAAEVIVGDLNDPDLLSALRIEYDVVLAGDVLEHLVDPQDVLNRAVRLLRPGGRAVISLPNVAHADARMALLRGQWDYRPFGLLDRTHLRFFTLGSIMSMVDRAGLVVTELRRVRIPAFETELELDRGSVPTSIVDMVLSDPEAETYQFVFSATRDTGDASIARLAQRNRELQVRLELAELRLRALELPDQEPLSSGIGAWLRSQARRMPYLRRVYRRLRT